MRANEFLAEVKQRLDAINIWMYVSVSSKEGKRRMKLKDTTLGPV